MRAILQPIAAEASRSTSRLASARCLVRSVSRSWRVGRGASHEVKGWAARGLSALVKAARRKGRKAPQVFTAIRGNAWGRCRGGSDVRRETWRQMHPAVTNQDAGQSTGAIRQVRAQGPDSSFSPPVFSLRSGRGARPRGLVLPCPGSFLARLCGCAATLWHALSSLRRG